MIQTGEWHKKCLEEALDGRKDWEDIRKTYKEVTSEYGTSISYITCPKAYRNHQDLKWKEVYRRLFIKESDELGEIYGG